MAAQLTHSGAFARPESGPIAQLLNAWERYRLYRETQAQLHALSIREREDIGLAGEDMDTVAHRAVYRSEV